MKALAEPIFVRGVSPFYDRRTLRPPELEGLRNLPQKFHFPYWGRKGKENKSRPSKTRQSAAQTSICAAARAGFFTGGSSTSRVRKKTKTPPSAKPKRAGAPPRRAFAPPRGRAFLREVRPHLGLGKKQKHPQAQSQNAPECRSDEHLRRRAGGHYTAAYMSGRAAAQSGVSAALWRVLAEGADPAVSPGETYGYGRPPVRTAFHVYLSAMRPDYRLDYRHSQAVSVSFRGVVGLEKL